MVSSDRPLVIRDSIPTTAFADNNKNSTFDARRLPTSCTHVRGRLSTSLAPKLASLTVLSISTT